MTVSLKNVAGEPVYVGSPDGRRVEDGEVVEVDGEISEDSPEDAYLIGPPLPDPPPAEPPKDDTGQWAERKRAYDEAAALQRLYPHATWEADTGTTEDEEG